MTAPTLAPTRDFLSDERLEATPDICPTRYILWQLYLRRLRQESNMRILTAKEERLLEELDDRLMVGNQEITLDEEQVAQFPFWGQKAQDQIADFTEIMNFYSNFPTGAEGVADNLHDELTEPGEMAVAQPFIDQQTFMKYDTQAGLVDRTLITTEILLIGYFIELLRTNAKVGEILGDSEWVNKRLEKIGYETPDMVNDYTKTAKIMFVRENHDDIVYMFHALYVRCREILETVVGEEYVDEVMPELWFMPNPDQVIPESLDVLPPKGYPRSQILTWAAPFETAHWTTEKMSEVLSRSNQSLCFLCPSDVEGKGLYEFIPTSV